ncbi:hypothetical protein TNCV_1612541 [Trichonephila clavipes]|nr:hypothetical protein TNCV_1612541 [Trichonephila clavipes]
MGFVLLEHRAFFQSEVLKYRVKMIGDNASIMHTCDPPPQDNEMPQFRGIYCTPHTHRAPSMFLGRNKADNMICFYLCSPDGHTAGGLELRK